MSLRKIVLAVLIIGFFNSCKSQSPELIKKVFSDVNSEINYLENRFIDLEAYGISIDDFNEDNLRYLWMPNEIPNTPSFDVFINNFNLENLKVDLEKMSGATISYSHIDSSIKLISEEEKSKYSDKTIYAISSPVFNKINNWAVIVVTKYRANGDIGGSGYFKIYRKLNNKWTLYHKFLLWSS